MSVVTAHGSLRKARLGYTVRHFLKKFFYANPRTDVCVLCELLRFQCPLFLGQDLKVSHHTHRSLLRNILEDLREFLLPLLRILSWQVLPLTSPICIGY